MDWSISKIIRIETGSVGISTNDLTALLRLYQIIDQNQTEHLVALARVARQPSWWSKYREIVSTKYIQFIEYEEAAYIIRSFEPLVIPGLLQTEEYANTVIRELSDDLSPKAVDARVEIRMTRQQLLEQSDPPLGFFIVDEAVIRRLLGDNIIMRRQLDRLITMADKPNVTIEMVPFSAGLYHGIAEAFSIVEFDDIADSDVLYLEGSRESILSHDETGEISIYREVFEELRAISLGPEGSLAYLREVAKEVA